MDVIRVPCRSRSPPSWLPDRRQEAAAREGTRTMIEIKHFDRLGRFDNDWLSARYHFSFANYHDPRRMGVGSLRVWNDDTIRPGSGFDLHGHRDMEIITYVRRGAITHQDHLGNVGRTEAGDVQVMSAGSGIMHAEFKIGRASCRERGCPDV